VKRDTQRYGKKYKDSIAAIWKVDNSSFFIRLGFFNHPKTSMNAQDKSFTGSNEVS